MGKDTKIRSYRNKIVSFASKQGIIKICFIAYAIIVIVGALVNWMIFLNNTTAFVISEQLNKHVERYEFLDENIDLAAYHSGVKDAMPISLDDFSSFMKADFDNLDNVNRALAQKQKDYESLRLEMESEIEMYVNAEDILDDYIAEQEGLLYG